LQRAVFFGISAILANIRLNSSPQKNGNFFLERSENFPQHCYLIPPAILRWTRFSQKFSPETTLPKRSLPQRLTAISADFPGIFFSVWNPLNQPEFGNVLMKDFYQENRLELVPENNSEQLRNFKQISNCLVTQFPCGPKAQIRHSGRSWTNPRRSQSIRNFPATESTENTEADFLQDGLKGRKFNKLASP
jgi:hypothetical protein